MERLMASHLPFVSTGEIEPFIAYNTAYSRSGGSEPAGWAALVYWRSSEPPQAVHSNNELDAINEQVMRGETVDWWRP